ncbi:hypothetical protein ID866_12860 [Astraeus odoratus]|nr:hypothetical protein ID866_12860 [Astraeus odoratus]
MGCANTLHHHFYTGLPDHIKDEICHVGKPQTLGGLHLLAQEVDAHYWECKEEIQHQPKSIASTGKQANPRNNSTQDPVETNLLQTKPQRLAATTQAPPTSVTSWVRTANLQLPSARGILTSTFVCSVVAMATSQTSVLRRKPRPKLAQPRLQSQPQLHS